MELVLSYQPTPYFRRLLIRKRIRYLPILRTIISDDLPDTSIEFIKLSLASFSIDYLAAKFLTVSDDIAVITVPADYAMSSPYMKREHLRYQHNESIKGIMKKQSERIKLRSRLDQRSRQDLIKSLVSGMSLETADILLALAEEKPITKKEADLFNRKIEPVKIDKQSILTELGGENDSKD